jgi:hypothetical protein
MNVNNTLLHSTTISLIRMQIVLEGLLHARQIAHYQFKRKSSPRTITIIIPVAVKVLINDLLCYQMGTPALNSCSIFLVNMDLRRHPQH